MRLVASVPTAFDPFVVVALRSPHESFFSKGWKNEAPGSQLAGRSGGGRQLHTDACTCADACVHAGQKEHLQHHGSRTDAKARFERHRHGKQRRPDVEGREGERRHKSVVDKAEDGGTNGGHWRRNGAGAIRKGREERWQKRRRGKRTSTAGKEDGAGGLDRRHDLDTTSKRTSR